MDFAFSEEQELLKKAARDFLEAECPKSVVRELEANELGYSPEQWRKMAELGWLGLILPEEYGGVGGSLLDLAVLFEELGRATCPSPIFSTIVLGALPILEAGNEQQKKQLLPKIARGETILTLALTEPETDYNPNFITTQALPGQGRFTINGTKLFVQNAHVAHHLLVVAKTKEATQSSEGLTIFVLDGRTPGIRLTPLITIAADKQFEVAFSNASLSSKDILGSLNTGWPVVEATLRKATAIQCVEMVGVCQKAMELAANYVKERIQFDRPIGSFQAVQHCLADMVMDVEGSRWTAYQAVWRLSQGLPAAREVAIAKAWTSDACQRVVEGTQHVHGGVGMDLEYDAHFYFRWAKALELNLGTAHFHKRTIEVEMGL